MPSGQAGAIVLSMAIAALQTILDRIDTWPEELQETAARLLSLLERFRSGPDWQVEEQDIDFLDELLVAQSPPAPALIELRGAVRARFRSMQD
jgi:hypothetical protein